MTRLLKIPIAARAGFASTSSCIDKLGGESRACNRNRPPDFCAHAAPVAVIAAKNAAPAAARTRRPGFIATGLLFYTRAVQPAVAIAGPPHFGLVPPSEFGHVYLPKLSGGDPDTAIRLPLRRW